MQMELMPAEQPIVSGYDIAGCCNPATQVGGDFFQFYDQDDQFAICLADVTGHGMAAAIPIVMFSGILKTQLEQRGSMEELFDKLNRLLYSMLDKRTFICFLMGQLDLTTGRMTLCDCGCPYPYHYRAATDELVELEMAAFPLGVKDKTGCE